MTAENKPLNAFLSKSLFLRGLQCHKSLYLHKLHPELRDETSVEEEAAFQSGHDVGLCARQLFQGGVEIPYKGLSVEKQISLTLSEIEKGADTVYEASFNYDGVFVKVDILHRGKHGWEIYEVKAAADIKDVYVADLAIQYYALKGAGIALSGAYLVHINRDYARNGDIEVDKLFTIVDLTDKTMERQDFIVNELGRMRKMLNGGMPEIDIGEYCSAPYECDFHGHCWRHIPKDSVFSIRGGGINKFELYRQGMINLADVPSGLLSDKQRMQAEATLGKKNFIDKNGIKEFLNSLWYPRYFIDFETFCAPIPLYNGTRPYQQIPFQYSIHYLEDEGADLRHTEFMAEPNTDPRKEIAKQLVDNIPGSACVVAYNQSFEQGILNGLAKALPEYKERISAIINNMRDLMLPFKRKDVYYWQMNGSYSLKAVLPALAAELSYERLAIGSGDMAMDAYFKMCRSGDPSEIESIRRMLFEYCGIDTLAMVKIIERLREMQ